MRDTITVASRCQSGYWVSGRRWSNAKALFRIFLRALTRRFYLAHFSVTENSTGARSIVCIPEFLIAAFAGRSRRSRNEFGDFGMLVALFVPSFT